jgi:hypothetical protein
LVSLALLLLPACGSSSDAPDATVTNDAADGGPSADLGADLAQADLAQATDGGPDPVASQDAGGPDGCGAVCWRPVPRVPAPEIGETATFVGGECRCPEGFACTGSHTTSTARLTSTHAVCEPMAPAARPLAMVFDFAALPPTVPVILRFRLNGGPWPQSSIAGAAGEITLTPERPQPAIVRALPIAADGALAIDLPVGRHAFRLEMGRGATFDAYRFPITNLAGELTVTGAGETTIDIAATPLTFDLRLAGAPFPAPRPGEIVALRVEGRYGHRLQIKRGPGQRLEGGTAWFEPGKYTVSVITEGAGRDPSLPNGSVTLTRSLEIGAAPLQRTFDVSLYKVAGAVTIDGKDLPAGASAQLSLEGPDGSARADVSPARPARYEVLAFAGAYDFLLGTTPGAPGDGVPSGGARLFEKRRVDGDLRADLAASTVQLTAEVTAGGKPLPDALQDRGSLRIEGAASHTFGLGRMGPAIVFGLVYQGPSQVTVVGTPGGGLPNMAVSAATGFVPSVTPVKFDLQVAPVTVTLTIDGGQPPAAMVPRGFFQFSRVDGTGETGLVAASKEGPLQATFTLTPGAWKGRFRTNTGAAGLPLGDAELPELVVPPEGITRSFELAGVPVALEVRKNGAALPDATEGKGRGLLQVGSTRVALPPAGPARAEVKVFPGVTSVAYICDDACGAGLPEFLTLVPLVRLGGPDGPATLKTF